MLSYRRGTRADIPAMSAVVAEGWRFAFPDRINKAWLDAMRDDHFEPELYALYDRGGIAFVAEEDGVMVGVIGCGEHESGIAEVAKMYVLPKVHRRGVGRELMDMAFEEFRARGYLKCCVLVLDTNFTAQAFYASCGFSDTGDTVLVNKTGDHLIDQVWARTL